MIDPLPWKILERLGVVSDEKLALEAGVSRATIRLARVRRKIGPTRHRWTPDRDKLLGTDTDAAVAAQLDVTPMAVQNRRRRLGVPPCGIVLADRVTGLMP